MPNYPSPGIFIEHKTFYPSELKLRTGGLAGFVGITQRGPLHTPVLVRNLEEFKDTFGAMIPEGFLPWAVQGFFENGGKACQVVRVAHQDDPDQERNAAPARFTLFDREQQPRLEIQAVEAGAWGNHLNFTVVPLEGEKKSFHLFLKYHKTQEEFLHLSLDPRDPNYAPEAVNRRSRWIRMQALRIATEKYPGMPMLENVCLESGRDGLADMQAGDFIGRLLPGGQATGLQLFQNLPEVTLLAVPDAVNPLLHAQENYAAAVTAVYQQLILLCESHPLRFCLLDAPAGASGDNILAWRAKFDSSRSALYFPWLRMADSDSGRVAVRPASGHLAGIYARLDRETKMLKHPANEIIRGAIGTTFDVDDKLQELLNPRSVNAIRVLRGQGIKVWGARTLSSNPEWRYINTRRLLSHVEQTLTEGMQWVVFENNNHDLWKTVIRSTTAFLLELWRAGYLSGAIPEEAFYVKCDEETNSEEARAAGILIAEIGLAIAKPAEFIVIRIKEKTMEE